MSYECKKCGHKFEELVFNRREKVRCPKCNGKNLKKLISAPSVILRTKNNSGSCSDGACNVRCPTCKD